MERKCNACGTWSDSSLENCTSCGALIDPKKLHEQKMALNEKEQLEGPKGRLDEFFAKWKATQNPVWKFFYHIAYGFWVVYMAIISAIIGVIAWGPG